MRLKSCPFCEDRRCFVSDNDGQSVIRVSCRGCGAQMYGHKRHFSSFEEATAAWNKRANEPELIAVGAIHSDTVAMLPTLTPSDHGAKIWPLNKARFDNAYVPVYTLSTLCSPPKVGAVGSLTQP